MISNKAYHKKIISEYQEEYFENSSTTTSMNDMMKIIITNNNDSMSLDESYSWNDTNNNTTSIRGYCPAILTTRNYILLTLITTIFCLSVVGNCLVVLTILQNRWMRTVTNFLLLNLAVSDLLFTLICMPPTLTGFLFQCFFAGPFMCKISAYMQPVSVAACSFTLVVIALERYKAICQPLHSRHWKTKSHALTMVFAVWTLAFLCSIPVAISTILNEYEIGKFNCLFVMVDRLSRAIFFGFLVTVLFFIPLSLMTVLYSLVITTLWKGMQLESQSAAARELVEVSTDYKSPTSEDTSINGTAKPKPTAILRSIRDKSKSSLNVLSHRKYSNVVIHAPVSSSTSTSSTVNIIKAEPRKHRKDTMDDPTALRSTHTERSLLAKRRVIKMLAAIVIEFFICWMPLYLFILYNFAKSDSWPNPPPFLHASFLILAYLSTCTNPVTYCFLNVKFRHAMLITIGCKSFVKNSNQYNNSVYVPSTAVLMPKRSVDERNGAVEHFRKLHQAANYGSGSHHLLNPASRNSSSNRLPVLQLDKCHHSPPSDRKDDNTLTDDTHLTPVEGNLPIEDGHIEKESAM